MAKKSALLLSADQSLSQELSAALNALGIHLTTLPGMPVAADLVKNDPFDFVFIPENSSHLAGWKSLARLVRKHTPASIITVLDQDGSQDIPLSDGFISRPIQARLLKAVIRHSLRDLSTRDHYQQQSSASLKQSEEKYEILFNAMREGLVLHEIVYNADNQVVDFRYLDVNPGFELITGLQREELVGVLLSQAPKWYDDDWPEDYLQVARSGRSFRVEVFVPELERHFDIVAFRTQPGQCAAIISDITQRVVHARELEGVARLSSALRSVETPGEIIRVSMLQIQELARASSVLVALKSSGSTTVIDATGGWAYLVGQQIPPDDEIAGPLLASGDILFRDDLSEDQGSLLADDSHRALSFIGLPLIVQGEPIGLVGVSRPAPISTAETYSITTIAENTASAIHRATLLENTQRSLQRLTAFHTIETSIASSLELKITLKIILDQAMALLNLEDADILLYDARSHTFEFALGRGFENRLVGQVDRLFKDRPNTDILVDRSILIFEDIANSQLNPQLKQSLLESGLQAYILVPLIAKNQIKGVLEIFLRSPSQIDPHWQGFLEILAGQAAVAIENATIYKDLQFSYKELWKAYETTLEGWSFAMDLRDKETEDHTRRVTSLSLKLARELGIEGDDLTHIRRGALLHDIGKIGIPDNILLKPGPLTPEERQIMCQHPIYAYNMLSRIEFLGKGIEIPFYHHEKWDGTGYPSRLAGEAIPLSARIFAIIDVWDSLISDRPYRAAWPKEKVIEHITNLSGSHFDPRIVQVFLEKRIWAEP